MTITELYEKLKSPEFQDVENGDLFYNFFIYQYPASKEYEVRRQIADFVTNLKRPTTYVEVLPLNLFEEFCSFLDTKRFLGHPSMLRYLLAKEKKDPKTADNVRSTLSRNAHSEEFLRHLHRRVMSYLGTDDDMHRPYVFLYGVGGMFPYLRVNELLAAYEDYNETGRYKLLVFYPGKREENSYRLFNILPDHNTYRATLLVNG